MFQRPKQGIPAFDYMQYAFGRGKYRRKTVGFGHFDKKEGTWDEEVYIREMSIIDAGLGCAVWDAAIIFARWVYAHADIFRGKDVLELGSGVGLPGILAARVSKSMILSDYLEPVLDNLRYNVDLNSGVFNADEPQDVVRPSSWVPYRIDDIRSNTVIKKIDWDEEVEHDDGQVDVILGSELTYSDLSIEGLTKTLLRYLKPDGVFYEVLSEDRDGVMEFCEMIEKHGFTYESISVDSRYLGKFGTKQRPETYRFWTFRRHEASMFPRME